MNELIRNLAEALRNTDSGSKAIAAFVGMAVLLGVYFAVDHSSQSEFDKQLFDALNAKQFAAVGNALSAAGIPFDSSDEPGAFFIYVDEDDYIRAKAAAFAADAMKSSSRGLNTDGGNNMFASATARDAIVQKKFWEEAENMLRTLDFVSDASVIVKRSRHNAYSRDADAPAQAVATITTTTFGGLSEGQKQAVKSIALNASGVRPEELAIYTHKGETVFDGLEEGQDGIVDRQLLAHQRDWDQHQDDKVNDLLAKSFGPNMANVQITSEWDWSQSVQEKRSAKKGTPTERTKIESERGVKSEVGGAPGLASNAREGNYGIDTGATTSAAGVQPSSKTSETTERFAPSSESTSTFNDQPTIKRLSIVAIVDESLILDEAGARNEALREELEGAIKAAATFDEARGDGFQLIPKPGGLWAPEVVEGADEVAEEASPPSTLLPMLLRRGVEIVAAIIFVVFLLKSLKASRRPEQVEITAEQTQTTEEEVDPEILARAQVSDLLENDPERVGSILANWARENSSVNA